MAWLQALKHRLNDMATKGELVGNGAPAPKRKLTSWSYSSRGGEDREDVRGPLPVTGMNLSLYNHERSSSVETTRRLKPLSEKEVAGDCFSQVVYRDP